MDLGSCENQQHSRKYAALGISHSKISDVQGASPLERPLTCQSSFVDSSEPHIHVTIQPLRVDMRPVCIRQLGKLAELADPPDSFYHRRLGSQLQLGSAEGRLRAQMESPAVEAFPAGVRVQVSPVDLRMWLTQGEFGSERRRTKCITQIDSEGIAQMQVNGQFYVEEYDRRWWTSV